MIIERVIFKQLEGVIESDEVIVLTGCRQTGKTTAFRYIYERITSSNKLFLDLENILNRKYFEEENYENVKTAFEFLGLDFSKKAYIFLDEIQYVKNLPSVIKYLKDKYRIKFFLTGSASFYLKNLFSESLSGRKYVFQIYPLIFKEFILFKGYKLNESLKEIPSNLGTDLDALFKEYINFGGFPGVVIKNNPDEKKRKLRDIFSSYFEMEVEKLRDFSKLQKVRDTLLLLFSRSASFIDISKLSQELGVCRITLVEYIDFFEKTFIFDFIKPYSSNKDVEIRKRNKIYSIDVGLAHEMGFSEAGGLFETAIYQNLRVNNNINYYRTKNNQEIDFILNKKSAIETKIFCHSQDVNALRHISSNLKQIKNYKIITLRRPQEKLKNVEWAPHFLLLQ